MLTPLHPLFKEIVDREFLTDLSEPAELCRDALLIRLVNDVVIEFRFASAEEYAVSWCWGEAELRIDTAPMHQQLTTFPNHFHDETGHVKPDLLTHPGKDPLENIRAIIRALLIDPLLLTHQGEA